jgi:hypothetical protein
MIEELNEELAKETMDLDVILKTVPTLVFGWLILFCLLTVATGFLLEGPLIKWFYSVLYE